MQINHGLRAFEFVAVKLVLYRPRFADRWFRTVVRKSQCWLLLWKGVDGAGLLPVLATLRLAYRAPLFGGFGSVPATRFSRFVFLFRRRVYREQ